MNATTAPRPSVMQLAIKEKAALYAAYIPLFAEGGFLYPRRETIVWAMMSMCCLLCLKTRSATP